MNKENKNCEQHKSVNTRLTYLEYLKQQNIKEFQKTIEMPDFKLHKIFEEPFQYEDNWKFLEKIQAITTKHQNYIILQVEAEQSIGQLNKTDTFKDEFEIKPKEPLNEEAEPENAKEKETTLRGNLKKYFQNPQISKEKEKPKDEDEDFMYEDFVLIEPDIFKEKQIESNRFRQGLIDLTAGSLAGAAQVYVSQPLDTIKVKQQTFPKLYKSMIKCFIHTYRKDGGFRGLYAGTVPAVVASVVENSVLFAAYGVCQDFVAFVMDIDKADELSALGNACAGFFAAFFSSFSLCPTELVKCKLQSVREMKHYVAKDSKAIPVTPFKLTRHIYETEGIPGFYRGLTSTLVREMPGFFFFFGGYEATREYFTEPGQTKEDIGALKTMCAGAVGGITLWTTTFPADVIKSRIQINNLKGSMLTVGSEIVKKEGFLALYSGLLPSILRTIPATATLFLVYEYTKKILAVKS
ncbi:mitochondrial ornithine transporter 1-like [Cochliomyia hominivorax]